MSAKQEDRVSQLVDIIDQQLGILSESVKKPGTHKEILSVSALDFILKGLLSLIRSWEQEDSKDLPYAKLSKKIEYYRLLTKDVRLYMLEMSKDWSCEKCSADVVSEVHISGVRKSSIGLALRCKSCGERTLMTQAGRKIFIKNFGELIATNWNPVANGFDWDGS